MIVLDTNVLSETLKPDPSPMVLSWLQAQERSSVFTTAVTLAEMLGGVELLAGGKRRAHLEERIEETLAASFAGRILPFDASASRLFAKITAGRKTLGLPVGTFDAMIAAIARAHHAAVATRNVADFEHCGVRLINPWATNS